MGLPLGSVLTCSSWAGGISVTSGGPILILRNGFSCSGWPWNVAV